MPYTIDNPPDAIKGLPKHAQEIFVAAYNSAWEQYKGDEAKCAAIAWSAVKKSYKQDADGNWVKLDEMETVNIEEVEILAVGKWHGVPGPKEYKEEDLDDIVKSFNALSRNKKLNYEPPVKLGHDDKQKLLQTDGYPAAGWVDSLKRAGDKLVASFRDVPKKIGDIIKAKGYKKVSSEIYHDYEIGGKKYPAVLKAVALLGGDIPAVKTLDDIKAQYGEVLLDEQGIPFEAILFEEVTLDEIMTDLDAWLEKAETKIHGKAGSPAIRTYLREVKAKLKNLIEKEPKEELAEELANMKSQPTKDDIKDDLGKLLKAVKDGKVKLTKQEEQDLAGGNIDAIIDAWDSWAGSFDRCVSALSGKADISDPEALCAWLHHEAEGMWPGEKSSEKEEFMEKGIRELLGLAEGADPLEAVKTLKAKVEANIVSLAEQEDLKSKVTKLTENIALKERDDRVGKAINSGKLTPAQKEWADKYALSDPSGFDKFVVSQPKVVDLTEKGSEGGEAIELTEAELMLGEKLGVSKEALMKVKKEEKK